MVVLQYGPISKSSISPAAMNPYSSASAIDCGRGAGFVLYWLTPSADMIWAGDILFPTETRLKSQGVSASKGLAK
jgi:hypothetical protein